MTAEKSPPPGPMDDLRAAFLQEAQDVFEALEAGDRRLRAAVLQTANVGVGAPAGPAAHSGEYEDASQALAVLAHRLKGSAALYGFPQLSALAGLMERLLGARPELRPENQQLYLQMLEKITAVLGEGVRELGRGGSDARLGLRFAEAGGAELMQALLREQPAAFALRQTHHHHEPEAAPETQTLEGQLRAFRLENDEVWEYFAPEVREHLAKLRQELERGDGKGEGGEGGGGDLNVMFRAAHTIKGSSYMVGLQVLGDHAHRAEDLLGAVRDEALALSLPVSTLLHAAADDMEDVLAVAEGAPVQIGARLERAAEQMRALLNGETPATLPAPESAGSKTAAEADGGAPPAPAAPQLPAVDTALSTIRVPAAQLEGLMDQVGALVAARAEMSQTLAHMAELQEAMQASQGRFQRTVRDFEERYLNPDLVGTEVGTETGAPAPTGTAATDALGVQVQGFAELEFDTYNDLNILSRSITELSADFSEVRRRLSGAVSTLREQHEASGKLLRELRVGLSRTSRVPFVSATTRLRRWAREHAARLDLEVQGGEVLVESSIAQRLSEPLMHLLTNAAFHGLEAPEARVQAGKPARGQVVIQAREDNHILEVSVRDDGAGIDLARVRERTLERGLRSGQELAALSEDEQLRLILLPGLSTAEQVGTVSGRGVGMDVVSTSVRQLGGELLIRSEAGRGTTFTLRLPATQRIVDLLIVQLTAGEAAPRAALPVSGVYTLQELPAQALKDTPTGPVVAVEGREVPVVDLRALWGQAHLGQDEGVSLAIMTSAAGLVALRVHEFEQIEELAVRRPGPSLGQLGYLSGLAVSVGGLALPVLDPAGLTRLARREGAWLRPGGAQEAQRAQERRVLLVDDSLSVRRLVGRMLERGGWRVETANDGQEALERLQLGEDFDAVITDLEMPRMNGYELLGAVRARHATQTLPLLVMTTRAGDKHQALAFQLGASDYFTKPVNETLLLRRLEAVVAGTPLAGESAGMPA